MASKKILIQVDLQTKGVDISADKVVNSINRMEGAQAKLLETQKKGRAQSGLNNAILLETGRLASDAAYGFTAIANNLSQVVTLFASFVESNKGFLSSMKQLLKSLWGTGGFLIAIQLIISFGPRLWEMLTGVTERVKELREAQEAANKVAGEQIGKLQTLVGILDSARSSAYEKKQAIDELNRSHSKLNLELDKEGNLTKESRQAIIDYIPILKQKAKAQAIMSLIQEKYVKLLDIETSSLSDQITIWDATVKTFKGMLGFDNAAAEMIQKAQERRQKALNDLREDIAELFTMLD